MTEDVGRQMVLVRCRSRLAMLKRKVVAIFLRCLTVALALTYCGLALAHHTNQGHHNIQPPPPSPSPRTLTLTFAPQMPSIPASTLLGTAVGTVTAAWSDGSAFTGTLMFAAPYGDDGGSFALSCLQCATANIVVNPAGLGVMGDGGTVQKVTVVATTALHRIAEARATTTQRNLSIRVLTSSQQVTCDIGPPAIVPAEAAAAGFTHCAANWDFSQPTYAVLSNWFDADGSNPNVMWHAGSGGVTFCNPQTLGQKTDPVTGDTVMNFHWLVGDNCRPGTQSNQIGGMTHDNWNGVSTFDVGNFYTETSARIEGGPCGTCPWNSGGPNDVYMGSVPEVDVFEFYTDTANGVRLQGQAYGHGGNNGADWANYAPYNVGVPANYSMFEYHKYGALHTSDGKTDIRVSMFLDDALASYQGTGITSNGNFSTRAPVLVSAGSNPGTATQGINLDVKYIRVWSCDAYKTSMCNGTTLATGNGLTYWH